MSTSEMNSNYKLNTLQFANKQKSRLPMKVSGRDQKEKRLREEFLLLIAIIEESLVILLVIQLHQLKKN